MSTFLLEVALDRRRVKERLATLLIEERGRRAPDGDPRGFPQPRMADLLGYSLRQYQRLEDADDASLPRFDDLQQLLEKLGRDASEVYAGDDEQSVPPTSPRKTEGGTDERMDEARLREIVREELQDVLEILGRIESSSAGGSDTAPPQRQTG